jgi:sugar transferase (PEP-CTERM/EpsH1 system associated)
MRPLGILFVVPYVPSRLRTRPFHLIRGLAERGHRIALFAVATSERELDEAAALRDVCARLEIVRQPTARSLWSCAQALGRGDPLQAAYCLSPAMNAQIRTALAAPGAYDVLHIEHLRAAQYGLDARVPLRIYDAVDCMSRLLAQTAERGPTWASRTTARVEMQATQRFERAAMERFDRVLLTSETDRRALLELATAGANGALAARVHALPNGVDLDYFTPGDQPREPATLIFVGRMGYHANLAGVRVLIEDIMPRVWHRYPEAKLLVVGADPPAALRAQVARLGERVALTGTVPDVRPYLARATVSVSPLPYAVGIQNKVLEAMATATPVVASPAACAGLDAASGTDLLVEAEPQHFANAAMRVLADRELARRIGAAGRQFVIRHHDWQRVVERLEAIYDEAIDAPAPGEAVQ